MAEFENCDQISEDQSLNDQVNTQVKNSSSTVFQWTRNATKLLLELYLLHKFDFRNSQIKKKHIWAQIKQNFINSGFKNINEETLDRKLRNMKSRYKSLKLNQSNSKNFGRITWEYFLPMDEIFFDDPILNLELAHTNTIVEPIDPLAIKIENFENSESDSLVNLPSNSIDFQEKIRRRTRKKRRFQPVSIQELRQIIHSNNKVLVGYLKENNKLQKERNGILRKLEENLRKNYNLS